MQLGVIFCRKPQEVYEYETSSDPIMGGIEERGQRLKVKSTRSVILREEFESVGPERYSGSTYCCSHRNQIFPELFYDRIEFSLNFS